MSIASKDSTKDQESGPVRPFKPFDIYLVDIQKTVTEKRIHCVKKRLTMDADLKYVAISYRWGELAEDLVVATYYSAHITSFKIDDFVNLCLAISKEVDLCKMQYVWVDAICVDQANMTRRKETIYHMNEIYLYANWILAVPDLHLEHLVKHPLNADVFKWIANNTEYLYHIIMNHKDLVEKMDDHWLEEELKVPKHLRCYLRSRSLKEFNNFCHPEDREENMEEKLFEGLTMHEKNQGKKEGPLNPWNISSRVNDWQRAIDDRHQKLEQAIDFFRFRTSDWSNRTWVISEYSIAKKKNSGIMKYWFISLAKYIENHLQSYPTFMFFQSDIRTTDLSQFKEYKLTKSSPASSLPVAIDSLNFGVNFRHDFNRLLASNTFLKMLLISKASKNSDRFNAVLPLSDDYRHHIKDQDTIKNWKITDMISVRMRLRQWLPAQDNLCMLYYFDDHAFGYMLPSFDRINVDKLPEPHPDRHDITDLESRWCNYNLHDPNSEPGAIIKDKIDEKNVSLIKSDDAIPLRYSIHIRPKFYQSKKISFKKDISHIVLDMVWSEVELNPTVDQLSWIRIPFYYLDEDPASAKNITEPAGNFMSSKFLIFTNDVFNHYNVFRSSSKSTVDPPKVDDIRFVAERAGNILDLIGCSTKNRWIVIKRHSELLTSEYIHSLDDWVWRQRGPDELCIY